MLTLTLLPLLAVSAQSVIGLVVFLLIIGIVLYFMREMLNPTLTKAIVAIVIVVALVWLLQVIGLWDGNFGS